MFGKKMYSKYSTELGIVTSLTWRKTARVRLIDGDNLDIAIGVNDAHGQTGHSHDDIQQQHIMAEGG